jgi:23S rRNA pseudouridine1911/1915/1917 synthase
MQDVEDDIAEFQVDETLAGQRLDKALAALCPEHSRTRLKNLIDEGGVRIDGVVCAQPSHKVQVGQSIALHIPDPVESVPQAENIPLHIVYEDDDLLVIDKPAGLVVHPGAGHWTGTLVNALLYHCGDRLSGIGGVIRPGIVHRLDRDTTGLMVVAKNDSAHRGLSEQLSDRSLSRDYRALVWDVTEPKGHIDKPMIRSASNRQKMSIAFSGGKEARTHYRRDHVLRDCISMVTCSLETGRTHQIRVHMESIKHPLLGDPVYGLQPTGQSSRLRKAGYGEDVVAAVLAFPRQALHAAHLRFIHPRTGEDMGFESTLPEDLRALISVLDQ